MIKNFCKKPDCLNWALPRKDYCRKHTHELKEKSKEYLNDLKDKKIKLVNGSIIECSTPKMKIRGLK